MNRGFATAAPPIWLADGGRGQATGFRTGQGRRCAGLGWHALRPISPRQSHGRRRDTAPHDARSARSEGRRSAASRRGLPPISAAGGRPWRHLRARRGSTRRPWRHSGDCLCYGGRSGGGGGPLYFIDKDTQTALNAAHIRRGTSRSRFWIPGTQGGQPCVVRRRPS